MKKETKEGNNNLDIINCMDAEYRGRRFHYDGWRVEDDGKSVTIKVSVDEKTKGEIILPWEEINRIRQFGWERQEEAAKKIMYGKRVHCKHLHSFFAILPECCQIGLDNGPCDVNCLTCKYIDGYIEEYDPAAEIRQAKIDWENMKIIEIK